MMVDGRKTPVSALVDGVDAGCPTHARRPPLEAKTRPIAWSLF